MERDDPYVTLSSTLIELPNLVREKTLSALPARSEPRRENWDPKAVASRTEKWSPKRAALLRLNDEPMFAYPSIEFPPSPMRVLEKTENPLPSRT
jgi:hypothetical protein